MGQNCQPCCGGKPYSSDRIISVSPGKGLKRTLQGKWEAVDLPDTDSLGPAQKSITISETTITFDYDKSSFANGDYEGDTVVLRSKGKQEVEFVLAEDNVLVVTFRGGPWTTTGTWIKY